MASPANLIHLRKPLSPEAFQVKDASLFYLGKGRNGDYLAPSKRTSYRPSSKVAIGKLFFLLCYSVLGFEWR